MLRGLTCKDECTSNSSSTRERLKPNTLNFAECFSALVKHFPALAKNFLALQKN